MKYYKEEKKKIHLLDYTIYIVKIEIENKIRDRMSKLLENA